VHCTGISIMCPAGERQIYADTVQSLMDASVLLSAQGIKHRFKWITCSDIVDLRNLMITLWYYKQKEASHILMVDKDMHFSPYLIWDMLNFDKHVTGAFYSRREFPASVVGKVLHDNDTIDDMDHGHLKVAGVGGGVVLIKRSAIKTMIEKMPDIVDKSMKHTMAAQLKSYGLDYLLTPFNRMANPEGGILSEDLSLCQRWRDCGGNVWANVKHPVGHIGPFEWAMQYEEFLTEQKAKQEKAA
jgi:hypothetical protein